MKKLTSHIQLNGKKFLTEVIVLKMSKNLQKYSNKNFKNLINLVLILSMPVFKTDALAKNQQKKQKFLVLHKNKVRIFSTIKLLFQAIKKENIQIFFIKRYYQF